MCKLENQVGSNRYVLTQQDYDTILFLTRLSYYEDVDDLYPEPFSKVATVTRLSGLRFNVFEFDEYVLVIICGTNSMRDWIANTKIALGIESKQIKQAKDWVVNNVWTRTLKPIVFVGHSLGGAIASCVADFTFEQSITFNSCGYKHLIDRTGTSAVSHLNIITRHDILTGITNRLPFKSYMQLEGTVVMVEDKYRFLSIKSHSDFGAMTKVKI